MRSRFSLPLYIPLIRRGFPLSVCASLTLMACKPRPAEPVKELPQGPPVEIVLEEEQPVRLALPQPSSSPSWLEAPVSKYTAPTLGPSSIITFGDRVSLHRTPHGILAVHAERGVLGPVTLPAESTWVGVDGEDHIWVGKHTDGALLMAKDALVASRPEGFDLIKTIPGARSWDVHGDRIAVATEQAIHVGKNHGEVWKERPIKALEKIFQVYVGADGVLVAQGESEVSRGRDIALPDTRVSRDDGISWELSSYQPGKLRRNGSWIWSGDTTCVATLASDGSTWSADPDLTQLPGYRDPREEMLSLTSELHVVADPARIATMQTPPPPGAKTPIHRGVQANCQDPILTNLPAQGSAMEEEDRSEEERGPRLEPCQGAACLRQHVPSPTTTTHQLYMLADGTCKWPEEVNPESDPRCTSSRGARRLSPPHLVLWERVQDTFEMHTPPAGCTPEKSFSSNGLHLILCQDSDDEAVTIWTMTSGASATWQQESTLQTTASRISTVSSTSDGTLVLHGSCDTKACETSYLRAPGEAGEQDLWRAIEVDGALAILPVPGGKALVASQLPNTTRGMMVWWAAFDHDQLKPVLEVTGIEQPVLEMSLDDDQKQILLKLGTVMRHTHWLVMSDGSLRQL